MQQTANVIRLDEQRRPKLVSVLCFVKVTSTYADPARPPSTLRHGIMVKVQRSIQIRDAIAHEVRQKMRRKDWGFEAPTIDWELVKYLTQNGEPTF